MIQLFRPADPDLLATEAHKSGLWLPRVVVILSTPGEGTKALMLQTPLHKLKDGEKPSWAPPQRRKRPKESIVAAGRRILRDEVGITNKGLSPVGILGYRNRVFPNNRTRPDDCPAQAQGWMLFYAHFQIEREAPVTLCPKSASAHKYVDEGEYVELIKTASPATQQLTTCAMVTGRVFPGVPMRL